MRRIPIMFIGQERTGKTSLKKSLKGEMFDPDEQSTRGIAIDPSLCKVTTEIWKAGQTNLSGEEVADAVDRHVAMATLKNLMELQEPRVETVYDSEEDVEDLNRDDLSKDDFVEDYSNEETSYHDSLDRRYSPSEFMQNAEENVPENQASPKEPASPLEETNGPDAQPVKEASPSEIGTSGVPEEIATLIETLIQKRELEDDGNIYCTLWDFAGQSVFYTTHPLFLTHRAMYLLVSDLSKNPNAEADPLIKQGLFQKFHDANLVGTNLDFLHFWMTSIASLAKSENVTDEKCPSLPPVIFVCTHADKPFGNGSPRDLARKVFGSLRQKPYKSHLVGDFFVVDNTRSGSGEEDAEVARLREKILEICRKLPQFQEWIPVRWMWFEKALKATIKEGFDSLKLSDARQIAVDVCGITEETELCTVLDFLHDLRVVVHFDDTAELDDLVVLDPQWLIDIVKEIITVRPFESEQSAFEVHWRELEEFGILRRVLLEHVWSHLINERNTVEALVSIMEKFNLICRWPSSATTEEYLVPHMLKSLPVTKALKDLLSSSCVPSLFVRFPRGQNPQVLFPYLLVCLITEWTREQPSLQRPKLFRNFARLFLNPSDGSSLVLVCHSSMIEVVLCAPTSPSGNFVEATCRRVHQVLLLVLEHMRLECRWLKAMSYELCFRCPVCCEGLSRCCFHQVTDCSKEECAHFYSEKELRESQPPIRCERVLVAMDTRIPLQSFSPWFDEASILTLKLQL